MARITAHGRLSGLISLFLAAACGPSGHNNADPEGVWLNIGYEELAASPQRAVDLDLSEAAARGEPALRLDDLSSAAQAAQHSRRLEYLETLEALDRDEMSDEEQSRLDALVFAYRAYAALAAFGHGDVAPDRASPYALTHLTGAWIETPRFLIDNARINSLVDAQDYLRLLDEVAVALRDDRLQLSAEANAGVVPPIAVTEALLERLNALMDVPPEETVYVGLLREGVAGLETHDAEVETAMLGQAATVYETMIFEELAALRDSLEKLRLAAPQADGLTALPHGAQWYAAALRLLAGEAALETASLSAQLDARLDYLDRAVASAVSRINGLEEAGEASLGDLLARAEQPALPETPEAQAMLEADLSGVLELMRRRLQYSFAKTPRATPEISVAAQAETPDWRLIVYDRRRDVLTIDPTRIAAAPGLLLPAQLYYAGYPGAALQADHKRSAELGLTDRLFVNPGFELGWALYALDVTRELNAYDDAPHALLGLLLLQRLETARARADIGLNVGGWTLEETTRFLVERSGYPQDQMRAEALRMAAQPGLSAAPAAGRARILKLREQAEYALGDDFSLQAFHAVLLDRGPRPLDAVAQDVERWIAATAARDAAEDMN